MHLVLGRTGIGTIYTNVPIASCQWMAAQVAALPRIIIALPILALIHGYDCRPEVNNINKPKFTEL
jgi:hypothetical protein